MPIYDSNTASTIFGKINTIIYGLNLGNTGYSYSNRLLVPLIVPDLTIRCEKTVVSNFTSDDYFS